MGLEKVVLNAIENADGEVADQAYFRNGNLYLYGAARADQPITGMRFYRVLKAIESVVNCKIEAREEGNDILIDFQ